MSTKGLLLSLTLSLNFVLSIPASAADPIPRNAAHHREWSEDVKNFYGYHKASGGNPLADYLRNIPLKLEKTLAQGQGRILAIVSPRGTQLYGKRLALREGFNSKIDAEAQAKGMDPVAFLVHSKDLTQPQVEAALKLRNTPLWWEKIRK